METMKKSPDIALCDVWKFTDIPAKMLDLYSDVIENDHSPKIPVYGHYKGEFITDTKYGEELIFVDCGEKREEALHNLSIRVKYLNDIFPAPWTISHDDMSIISGDGTPVIELNNPCSDDIRISFIPRCVNNAVKYFEFGEKKSIVYLAGMAQFYSDDGVLRLWPSDLDAVDIGRLCVPEWVALTICDIINVWNCADNGGDYDFLY